MRDLGDFIGITMTVYAVLLGIDLKHDHRSYRGNVQTYEHGLRFHTYDVPSHQGADTTWRIKVFGVLLFAHSRMVRSISVDIRDSSGQGFALQSSISKRIREYTFDCHMFAHSFSMALYIRLSFRFLISDSYNHQQSGYQKISMLGIVC